MLNQQETVYRHITKLKQALQSVKQEYFHLVTIANDTDTIHKVRERVFCYELYHQIRTQEIPSSSSLRLHAEPDKSGHIRFKREDQKNPDFIFHLPSSMEQNILVVEVKGGLRSSTGRSLVKNIKKDFETLITFVEDYHFKGGAFILYNHNFEQLKKSFKDAPKSADFLNTVTSDVSGKIYILTIETAHSTCEEYKLFDLCP